MLCEKKLDLIYSRVVSVLTTGEELYIPKHNKNYYKFWWNEELSVLKQAATESDRLWKAAGKPRSGHVYEKCQQNHLIYCKCIRECERKCAVVYTNNLHDYMKHF